MVDDANWSECIGRTRYLDDVIDPAQAARVAAVLGQQAPETGGPLPALWHWAFFPDLTATGNLGDDGHATRGSFLPAVDLPNRMWAGSRISFLRPVPVGSKVRCTSTIDDVQGKQGRSGPLVFVTVRHDYAVDGKPAIREQQDIVYRDRNRHVDRAGDAAPAPAWEKTIWPSPVLLFRYSAVTFNGHRIHYDHPYVTEFEGYPGLIVHGPLIATLMCSTFVHNHPGARLRRFSFRGKRALFVPNAFDVAGRLSGHGQAKVWAADAGGIASSGEIEFE